MIAPRSALFLPLGLLLATTSLVGFSPAPAEAALSSAISDGELAVESTADPNDPSTDPCTPGGDGHQDAAERVLVDGTQSLSVDDSEVFANPGDASDTVATSGAVGARVRSVVQGDVRTVSVTGDLRSSNTAAKGTASACDIVVDGSVSVDFDLDLLRPGYLTLSAVGERYGNVSLTLFHDDKSIFNSLNGGTGTTTTRMWAPAGSYLVFMSMELTRGPDVADEQVPTSLRNLMSTTMTYHPAGVATGPATGTRLRPALLPGRLSCAGPTATLRWRPAARRAVLAKVTVNGRQARVVRNPRPGAALVLRGLPRTTRVTIVARAGRFSVRRTYEACTARGY